MLDISDRLTTYEPLWENWYKDSFIGGGAFGKVYKLKQNFFGETRYSAVKILPIDLTNELSTMSNGKEQFIEQRKASVVQEIKNMYKLKGQKNLVQCIAHNIKDICDDNGNVVGFDVLIQMEYYVSLTNYMRDNGMLSPDQVEKLATDIATGLKAMHDINMLHRDIKPGNIFVDKNGDLALGDFGISKQEMRSSYSTIAGTHSFIAPEVWKIRDTNKRYTKTADIYSYGIVLYCLLNNNMLPLVNEGSNQNDIEAAIDARLAGQPFPPPKNGSDKLKSIVMKCCEYRPEDRFQSMGEVLSALNDQSFRISPKPAAAAMQQDSFATVYAGDTFNNQSMGNNYQSPIQPQQQNQYGQPQNFQQNNGYGTPFVYQQGQNNYPPYQMPAPQQQDSSKKSGGNGKIIATLVAVVAVLLIALIAVILVFTLKLDNDSNDGKSTEPAETEAAVTVTEAPQVQETTTTAATETSPTETTTEETTTETTTTKETTTTTKATTKKKSEKITKLKQPEKLYSGIEEGDLYYYQGVSGNVLYYGPDESNYEVIDYYIPQTDILQEHGRLKDGSWLYVSSYNSSQCGWIRSNQLVEFTETPGMGSTSYLDPGFFAYITKDVALRRGPNQIRDIVPGCESIKHDSYVSVTGIYGNWYFITSGSYEGWVPDTYIKYESSM